MLKKIILCLLLAIVITAIGIYNYTNGNPKEFISNFRQGAFQIDSHHTHIVGVNSFSWMKVKDPNLIPKVLGANFGFTSKQPESFLLIVNGDFATTGGYYPDNQPIIPEVHSGVGFAMVGKESNMTWGAESVDYNKLNKLGEVHTLPYPIGKITWFFLYDIYGISQSKIIITGLFIIILSLIILKLVRRNKIKKISE